MAKFEIVMPKMGESIIEATITKWLINEGDQIEEDDSIVEIATDKVDSEIPSPVDGVLKERLFNEGDVVAVGTVIAIIDTDEEDDSDDSAPEEIKEAAAAIENDIKEMSTTEAAASDDFSSSSRFYSPLVKSIAQEENISLATLETIKGSGKDGRVTKEDIMAYIKEGKPEVAPKATPAQAEAPLKPTSTPTPPPVQAPNVPVSANDEVVPMDRMRKLIADHMVMSKQVSPHVTMFIDVDVTNIVNWRNKIKNSFLQREGEKITYTPIIMEAAAKAIKAYPGINASTDGDNIILKKNVNIGMATALPNDNLIVPVIQQADQLNLVGLTKEVNRLANNARNNNLSPDDIQNGTFTITNFGSFNSLTGTPIINQPQAAILGVGAIRKVPVVIETPQGDVIGIRHIMIFSLAFDHRIVDGALGGKYLQKLKEVLEGFDPEREI